MSSSLTAEKIPAGEARHIKDLLQHMQAKLRQRYSKGVMLRHDHPKMHGLVRAYLIVEPGLPAELQTPVFQPHRRYRSWVRFSNLHPVPRPDLHSDLRGMAIKLTGVAGDKLSADDSVEQTQDFLLQSTETCVAPDVAQYARWHRAMSGGASGAFWYCLRHWKTAFRGWQMMLKCANPLHIAYFSVTPFLFGKQVVKFAVVPATRTLDSLPDHPADDFLRSAMVEQLAQEDVVFDFMVQVQTDPVRMPVEDASVLWPEALSPFRKVATIRIPRQEFDSEAQRDYGEQMMFNPWNAVAEHRPVGGINRARKAMYEALNALRRQHNHTGERTVVSWDIPGQEQDRSQNSRLQWGNTTQFRQ